MLLVLVVVGARPADLLGVEHLVPVLGVARVGQLQRRGQQVHVDAVAVATPHVVQDVLAGRGAVGHLERRDVKLLWPRVRLLEAVHGEQVRVVRRGVRDAHVDCVRLLLIAVQLQVVRRCARAVIVPALALAHVRAREGGRPLDVVRVAGGDGHLAFGRELVVRAGAADRLPVGPAVVPLPPRGPLVPRRPLRRLRQVLLEIRLGQRAEQRLVFRA